MFYLNLNYRMGAAGGEESVSAVPIPIARKIKLDQQVIKTFQRE